MDNDIFNSVKAILGDLLQLGARANEFDRDTILLGNLPELDSMAVVNIITALEDQYGFVVDDDEMSAETFETLGNLVDFVERKVSS